MIDKPFAAAEADVENATPKVGYLYRVLTAQGPGGNGGRLSYVDDNGNMTGGYALIGFPSEYDVTGRYSFIIGCNGVVLQKDMGIDTGKVARAMTEFDPDTTWISTE